MKNFKSFIINESYREWGAPKNELKNTEDKLLELYSALKAIEDGEDPEAVFDWITSNILSISPNGLNEFKEAIQRYEDVIYDDSYYVENFIFDEFDDEPERWERLRDKTVINRFKKYIKNEINNDYLFNKFWNKYEDDVLRSMYDNMLISQC